MPVEMLTLAKLRGRYRKRPEALADVIDEVLARLDASNDPAVFISRVDRKALRAAGRDLVSRAPDPESLPLWGVPYAVKDNIDVLEFETTAACPAFAYRPQKDAEVVARLRAAGALVVGKTNLDQFATGLNGTRSPYGAPRNVFDSRYISGGSSSGSAVAVAAGIVAFSLGTDTAGSGRVPAAFNNIVGIKPSVGALSVRGVVAACRSLDCVSIFSTSVGDGAAVRRIVEGYDVDDPFSVRRSQRSMSLPPRLGAPSSRSRAFFGDSEYEALYARALDRVRDLGWSIVEFDYAPFHEIASLLYEGPWLAERTAAVGEFAAAHPDAIDPSVRALLDRGRALSAVDAFNGQYKLSALKRAADAEREKFDAMILPTAPTIYTVEDILADPIRLNSRLGRYTNFVNFLGMAAVATPSGFRNDGLPFGVTFVGDPFCDDALASLAAAYHQASGCGAGPGREQAPTPAPAVSTPQSDRRMIAVVGAHLSGQPLNVELVALGGRLEQSTRTTGEYRLYLLPGSKIAKPGLIRAPGFSGPGIDIEIWSLPTEGFGSFVAAIPAPLGIGKIQLEGGEACSGFLCEAHAIEAAEEITAGGGWRAYLMARSNGSPWATP